MCNCVKIEVMIVNVCVVVDLGLFEDLFELLWLFVLLFWFWFVDGFEIFLVSMELKVMLCELKWCGFCFVGFIIVYVLM